MKKPLPRMALSALVISMLLVSGCGMFHSSKAWETAKQESPLEIPPSLDRPSTSAALVVPPPGANQPDSAAKGVATESGQVSDGFVLKDTVDSTYQRVGRVLEHGDLGQVLSHDDEAHSYTLKLAQADAQAEKPGFFKRLFHWGKRDAGQAATAGSNQVVIQVTASGSDSSEVRAEGGAAAVGQVVDGLKSRLGG